MELKQLIECGQNITTNNATYYRWLIDTEEFLSNLPNTRYFAIAKGPLDDANKNGENQIIRNRSVAKITAILTKIYDNQQESFLQNNITTPLLSIFQDPRLIEIQKEFEQAIVFKNEGQYGHSVIESCKAAESMMKEVCKYLNIDCGNKSSIGGLIGKLQNENIIPIDGMIAGYPVMRNKAAAHGSEIGTYVPTVLDADFEINRVAALLLYLYKRSGMEVDENG